MVVDADDIPLGFVSAPANCYDSPLFGENLDVLEVWGPLPERVMVHLDRAYDIGAPASDKRPVTCSLRSLRRASQLYSTPQGGGQWNAPTSGTTLTIS
jgi:hypothetical protein